MHVHDEHSCARLLVLGSAQTSHSNTSSSHRDCSNLCSSCRGSMSSTPPPRLTIPAQKVFATLVNSARFASTAACACHKPEQSCTAFSAHGTNAAVGRKRNSEEEQTHRLNVAEASDLNLGDHEGPCGPCLEPNLGILLNQFRRVRSSSDCNSHK